MTDVDDLVMWLREQIAEDRTAALLATAGPWRHSPEKHWRKPGTAWCEEAVFAGPAGADAMCIAGTGNSDDPQSMADAKHIARHDPARVLREVESKGRILDDYERYAAERRRAMGGWDSREISPILKALALPYCDRPGYREEWRP